MNSRQTIKLNWKTVEWCLFGWPNNFKVMSTMNNSFYAFVPSPPILFWFAMLTLCMLFFIVMTYAVHDYFSSFHFGKFLNFFLSISLPALLCDAILCSIVLLSFTTQAVPFYHCYFLNSPTDKCFSSATVQYTGSVWNVS